MTEEKEDNGSSLMKLVEAIAITPKDARELVSQYEGQVRKAEPDASGERIQVLVTDKIIERYSKMAAATGGATSLAGVIPGIGTAVAMVGGGVADVSLCMKLSNSVEKFPGNSVQKFPVAQAFFTAFFRCLKRKESLPVSRISQW